MGSDDVLHGVMGVLMTAGGLIVGLVAWTVKGLVQRLEKAEDHVTGHATEIEVLKRSSIASRVDDHESRLTMIESSTSDLKADVKVRLEKAEDHVTGHETEIEVLKRSSIVSRVDDHESRLKAIEGSMSDLKADVKVLIQKVEHVADVLEKRR